VIQVLTIIGIILGCLIVGLFPFWLGWLEALYKNRLVLNRVVAEEVKLLAAGKEGTITQWEKDRYRSRIEFRFDYDDGRYEKMSVEYHEPEQLSFVHYLEQRKKRKLLKAAIAAHEQEAFFSELDDFERKLLETED